LPVLQALKKINTAKATKKVYNFAHTGKIKKFINRFIPKPGYRKFKILLKPLVAKGCFSTIFKKSNNFLKRF